MDADSKPVLLYNNDAEGVKVHTSLIRHMGSCDRFDFSVAFITMGGLSTLYQAFRDIHERGVKGRILTTDYLGFNDPNALDWLLEHTDHEVRVCEEMFHTKGYMFYEKDSLTAFIGSSNLTDKALCTNLEWNLKLTSVVDPLRERIQSEFERMWELSVPLTKEWIQNYREHRIIPPKEQTVVQLNAAPKPNQMQREALESLHNLREEGKQRAILISATGTGKTYLSAFDVKEFAPKRFLFLVHNENILKDAKESYFKVLGDKYSLGFYTGNKKEEDSDGLFATIQTMVNHKDKFSKDYFDYIVCDEAHHSTASMYSEIITYFTPCFMLGMTATPERTDDADVFKMFDYNVAYEIRLNKALEMGILCPFHYYGVSEISVDGKLIDDNSTFNALTCKERIKNIIEKAEYYRPYGDRARGLIFCSTIEECEALSKMMNECGYRTVALSAKNSIEDRKKAMQRLQSDDDNSLDYIFTRDVFNEGVDIPLVNQILMLRPTQSAIIFIQQLGRGLRRTKDPDKSLIVLDFIGNYENNFMIPTALSGDRSCDKDNLRRFMMSRFLPGCSTVGFERIVEDRILSNIDRSKLSTLKMLKNEYLLMKSRLGRPPSLCDLLHGGSLDPTVLVSKMDNLNTFRTKAREEHLLMSDEQDDALTFISSFVNGKRIQELKVLRSMVDSSEVKIDSIDDPDTDSLMSAINVLNGKFQTNSTMSQHPSWALIVKDGNIIRRSKILDSMLSVPELKELIVDAIDCGEEVVSSRYAEKDDLGFTLYQKYLRKDVCRILNWEKDCSATMYGYMLRDNTCPIFVTYHKGDDISSTTKYVEGFENRDVFDWMSKSGRNMMSADVREILASSSNGLKIPVFIKKSDSEGIDFYYVGQANPIVERCEETTLDGKTVVGIPLKLRNSVPEELYGYLLSSDGSS